jgi:hypothetical protein
MKYKCFEMRLTGGRLGGSGILEENMHGYQDTVNQLGKEKAQPSTLHPETSTLNPIP